MQRQHFLTALAVLALILVGCGGDDEETAATATTADASPAATATSGTALEEGNCDLVFAGTLTDSRETMRVYCVDADGSDQHPLTALADEALTGEIHEAFPVWSPDGTQIAFVRTGPDGGVFVINADGTGEQRIVEGWARDLAWSPDGTTLAFGWLEHWPPEHTDGYKLMVVNADGSGLRQLVEQADTGTAPESYLFPVWSPDGTQVLFQTWKHAERAEEDQILISIVNADGTNLHTFDTGDVMAVWTLTWWPDGKLIAFVGGVPDDPNPPAIYTMQPDGSDMQRRGEIPIVGPFAWSPNGQQIVVSSTEDELRPEDEWIHHELDLYLIQPDGTGATLVESMRRTAEVYPAWSPDGSRIAYLSHPTQPSSDPCHLPPGIEMDIGVVGTDGSQPTIVAPCIGGGADAFSAPVWRPDGD